MILKRFSSRISGEGSRIPGRIPDINKAGHTVQPYSLDVDLKILGTTRKKENRFLFQKSLFLVVFTIHYVRLSRERSQNPYGCVCVLRFQRVFWISWCVVKLNGYNLYIKKSNFGNNDLYCKMPLYVFSKNQE